MWQEEPAVLGHELKCLENVLDVIVLEEVGKVEAREAHSQEFLSVHERLLKLPRQLNVNAKYLLAIHGGALAARPRLDAKEITEQLSNIVAVQYLAILRLDHKGKDRYLGQFVVAEQEHILDV